jgi:transcriptional regulator NrdR family protein
MECPNCFNTDSKHIYDATIKDIDESRPLHKCNQCESVFWHDTGEKVQWLSHLCETRWSNRKMCNKDVLTLFPKLLFESTMNIEVLDRICSECPHKKFILPVKSHYM